MRPLFTNVLSNLIIFFLIFGGTVSIGTAQPSEGSPQDTGAVFLDSVSLRVVSVLMPDTGGVWSPAHTEAFFDGLMAGHLEANHIAGGTVSIVKDGKLFFSKGYGYTHVANKEKVDPEKSLFLIGSISKLFTWTAVMQLVEKDSLDLDKNVNDYLTDFKIPDTYEEPITLRHLMTHTAGFEDMFRIFARSPEDIKPLGEFLEKNMPKRVRAPGEVTSYSNYGSALAGYIVEQVSGMPFEDYIEKNIFQPLEMKYSTFRQPQPQDLRDWVSEGYSYSGEKFVQGDAEYIHLGPAGILASSANDIAKFMLAHLPNNLPDSLRILSLQTVEEMHRRQFTHAPSLPGICLGFYETELNGQKMIGHGGDTRYFHSLLVLIPEKQIGIFFSFNSENGPKARTPVIEAFLDRYFPREETDEETSATSGESSEKYEGFYRSNRMVYSSFEKVFGVMSVWEVKAKEGGLLEIGSFMQNKKTYKPDGKGGFMEEDGEQRIVFRENEKEDITHAFISDAPILALDRLPWYESPRLQLTLLTICGVMFLLMVILWPISLYAHQVRRVSGGKTRSGIQHTALLAGRFSSLAYLLFIGGFIALSGNFFDSFAFEIPPALPYLQILPLVGGVLTIVMLIFIPIALKRRYWNTGTRLQYIFTAFAGIVFLLFLNYVNLLAWNF
ncbi:MAG: serine hydrolase domain-containing protein [Bacteroidia bacterium]|nr:serine hydrolase domain-containing protein [Bacteroidia bacterium]